GSRIGGAGAARAGSGTAGGAAGASVAVMAGPLRRLPGIRPSGLVVTSFEIPHLSSGLLRPARVAFSVADDRPDRQPGPQLRPSVVPVDGNAHRDGLHDFSGLAGDYIAGHHRERGARDTM